MSARREDRRHSPVQARRGQSKAQEQSTCTTYLANEDGVQLARPMRRYERLARLASSLTWSHETSSEGPSSARSVVDVNFEKGMLDGLNRRVAERSSQFSKDRVKGTMTPRSNGAQLPNSVEDVRRRQEHVERRVVQMPVLLAKAENDRSSSAMRFVNLVRNAALSELRDLHRIVSSLEARRFDICEWDVKAMFEWFGTFENFIRMYLTASEKEVYVGSNIDEWATLQGNISRVNRKHEKKRIIAFCDHVQEMKRKMVADGAKCGKHIEELHKRVDKLTMRVVRFLNEEVEQVPAHLESKYSRLIVDKLFANMVGEMRKVENGKDMVVLMSRGVGGESGRMANWVREMCGNVNKVSVSIWIRKFVDRHINYAVLFEIAEQEYREVYTELSNQVDDEIADIHDRMERSLRLP